MNRPIAQEDINRRLIRAGEERYKNKGRFPQPGSTFIERLGDWLWWLKFSILPPWW